MNVEIFTLRGLLVKFAAEAATLHHQQALAALRLADDLRDVEDVIVEGAEIEVGRVKDAIARARGGLEK